MTHNENVQPEARAPERRPYRAPALQVFGRISTLTQSASGCATSDNPACNGGPTANMGPIPRLQR